MTVKFTDDSIGIYEGKKEIVYWYKTEWHEDPDLVYSIANAVKLAYTDPEKLKKLLKK
jgi:hypothetical protein